MERRRRWPPCAICGPGNGRGRNRREESDSEEGGVPMQARKTRSAHPYIERKRGVCGGRPVIKGTRFPVSSVAIHYRRGLTAEDILQDFPQLTPTQVYGALAYYFDHQEEIDAEIEQIRLQEQRTDRDASLQLSPHGKTHSVSGS